jgi:hypothetical protein
MSILLDGQPLQFDDSDFPLLIQSREGLGASTFVINLMADLFRAGRKILFFSAKPAAKEGLRRLLGDDGLAETEFAPGDGDLAGKRAVVVGSSKAKDFLSVIRRLPDMPERVILVKNVEDYGPDVIEAIEETRLFILAGDLDRTPLGKEIWDREFATRICFSPPVTVGMDAENFPILDKFHGQFVGRGIEGLVRLG